MEFAGVDKAARSKTGVWKMQEWTIWHHVAEVDFAGVDKSARCGKGGHCRSGQCGTMWQWWTMQEWGAVTKAVYKITSLANDSLYIQAGIRRLCFHVYMH